MNQYTDLLCPKCNRKVGRITGEGKLEIRCRRCGALIEFTFDQHDLLAPHVKEGPTRPPNQWWAAAQRKPGPSETK